MTTKLKTTKLFVISLTVFIIGMVSSYIFFSLGYKNKDTPFIVLFLMIAFGLNIAGVILGFTERKINKKKATFGIIGNLLFIILYISSSAYAIASF